MTCPLVTVVHRAMHTYLAGGDAVQERVLTLLYPYNWYRRNTVASIVAALLGSQDTENAFALGSIRDVNVPALFQQEVVQILQPLWVL